MHAHICEVGCVHTSPRDVAILRLIAEDLTNPEIGLRLGLARATIRNNVHMLLARYGAHSRTGLVVAALQAGALRLDQIERRERLC